MICLDCLKSQLVPACTNDLVLGTIPDIDTDVIIYVRDVTTAKLHSFQFDINSVQIVSSGTGVVTLPMDTKFVWMQDHYYEVWVTHEDADSIEDMLTVTVDDGIGGTVLTDCINLRIAESYNQDRTLSQPVTLTLVSSE